ncbi:MAG: thioredoxin family protein [Saprospiraceae bacterium]|nr:thioredoxin family protein [Saprospiraceae bacterium]
MAFKESNMLALGTKAPDFSLPDTISGKTVSFSDIQSNKATVVMFLCNHCPYVIHVNPEIVTLTQDYQPQGVNFVGISSNDVERYPADSPEKMKVLAEEVGYTFPYLYDESQEVAKQYDAACTPDFYLFDGEGRLAYRGRLDESRPKNDKPLTGADLRTALDAILNGLPITDKQYPSGGCGIKWKE